MDMNISNLKCPQYLNFEAELKKCNFPNDLNDTASSLSVKDNPSDMDTDDFFSVPNNNYTPSSSLLSIYSDTDLGTSSYQLSPSGYSLRSESGIENYPVRKLLLNQSLDSSVKKKQPTKPKPFKLKDSQKRKREDEHVPLAEQVARFLRKTPARFHSVGTKAFESQKHWSPPQVTHPKSPNLQAAKRIRGTDFLSREEIEAQEVEAMRRYRFRARPARQSILNRRESLKVTKKLTTKAKEIHLRTAQRAAEIYAKKKEEEKPYEFRARPIPVAMFEGPKGLKEVPRLPTTEAKTPNFALKKRAEKWKSQNILNETTFAPAFKAQPLPLSEAFVVKHEKKPLVVQPFSFEAKQKEWLEKKEQKIQEVIEKENTPYIFKAQPMPSSSPSALPKVPRKPSTEPQPFHFHLEEKSSKHSSFNSSMDNSGPSFKARPATVLKKPPFVPERPGKHTEEVQEFHLHTDVRASERLKLKELNLIKEKEHEEALERLRLLKEEEERREIERIRREAEFKAKPIMQCKPLEIKPSNKPLTQPISPKFQTDVRLQTKN